jgi:uncharacterized protein (DUF1697 family)
MPATHVALLRGVNVGGNNKLPMKDLVTIFAGAGCRNVSAYIQSGNIIFSATPKIAALLAEGITVQIFKQFGFQSPVILRTAEQLRRVLSENPFVKAGADEDRLYVMFLAGVPDAQKVTQLDPDRSPPDRFLVRGQEIYLQLPNGGGRSKPTNTYFDSKLGTISTARNWRTVTKLVQLMQA